jgi:hypothetical protein
MARNTYVLSGLRRQYGVTLGAIQAGADKSEDLAHLAAVLLMFNSAEDLSAIAPVRPYRANRGRWLAKALAVLRTANEPLSARAIARRIMAADGIPQADYKRFKALECGLYATLTALEGDGVVAVVGRPKRWAAER